MPKLVILVALTLSFGTCGRGPDAGNANATAPDEESRRVPPSDPAQIARIQLPAELDRVLRDYETGWRNGDEKALAALFTPDGFILRPGHPPVRSRDSIEVAYTNSSGSLHLHAFDFGLSASTAFIIGGYGYGPDTPDSGKYLLALRKLEDGKWYIAADMDNGNVGR